MVSVAVKNVGALLLLALAPLPVEAYAVDLFFSEYVEGTGNNKALEIYNGTAAAIDLATQGYNIQMFFNGSTSAGLTINLAGIVAANDVFVLAQALANSAILAVADQTNAWGGWFNGDDAIVLRKGTTAIDAFGQVGNDPGTEWVSGPVSTADNTLRRNIAVLAGDTDAFNAFNPPIQWDVFVTDTFGGLGSHNPSIAAVPEPAGCLLLGTVLGFLGRRMYRMRKTA